MDKIEYIERNNIFQLYKENNNSITLHILSDFDITDMTHCSALKRHLYTMIDKMNRIDCVKINYHTTKSFYCSQHEFETTKSEVQTMMTTGALMSLINVSYFLVGIHSCDMYITMYIKSKK